MCTRQPRALLHRMFGRCCAGLPTSPARTRPKAVEQRTTRKPERILTQGSTSIAGRDACACSFFVQAAKFASQLALCPAFGMTPRWESAATSRACHPGDFDKLRARLRCPVKTAKALSEARQCEVEWEAISHLEARKHKLY